MPSLVDEVKAAGEAWVESADAPISGGCQDHMETEKAIQESWATRGSLALIGPAVEH